jgi:serine/threonine protein kinase
MFDFGQVLGEGAFGQVRLCTEKTTNTQYACKILKKDQLVKAKQTKYVKSERDILLQLQHPNISRLYFTFADEKRLYFVMELISGGELLSVLKKVILPVNLSSNIQARGSAARNLSILLGAVIGRYFIYSRKKRSTSRLKARKFVTLRRRTLEAC